MFYTYYNQTGNGIQVRYKNGSPETQTTVFRDYKPKLYCYLTDQEKEPDAYSIFGDKMKAIQFDRIWDAKKFADEYKQVPNFGLMGNSNYANQFIIELFNGETPEFKPELIRIGRFDIEVDAADEFPNPEDAKYPITGVTTHDSIENKFFVYALPYKEGDTWSQDASEDEIVRTLPIEYRQFETEQQLVMALLELIKTQDFDVISGWNSEGFDVPYIINRGIKLFGEPVVVDMLSPYCSMGMREITNKYGKKQEKWTIEGRPHLDYMEMYKKHTFKPRESFKLDFIAHAELGRNKISYEEAKSLHQLYRTNFQKYVDYNIIDVWLMCELDKKLGLFDLTFALSYYTLCNFEDTLGTVKIWEQLVAKFLYGKGKVPLFSKRKADKREFEGAYVKEPVAGFYDWIVSSDLNSLYPHIEQQWNIGPETHVPYERLPEEIQSIVDNSSFDDLLNKRVDLSCLHKHGLTMAANLECYRTDQMSFFSEIKRDLYLGRKGYKKKMLGYEQQKVNVKAEMQRRGLV